MRRLLIPFLFALALPALAQNRPADLQPVPEPPPPFSASAALTAITFPETGLYTSEAAFTDSTTATAAPRVTVSPTLGSST